MGKLPLLEEFEYTNSDRMMVSYRLVILGDSWAWD